MVQTIGLVIDYSNARNSKFRKLVSFLFRESFQKVQKIYFWKPAIIFFVGRVVLTVMCLQTSNPCFKDCNVSESNITGSNSPVIFDSILIKSDLIRDFLDTIYDSQTAIEISSLVDQGNFWFCLSRNVRGEQFLNPLIFNFRLIKRPIKIIFPVPNFESVDV